MSVYFLKNKHDAVYAQKKTGSCSTVRCNRMLAKCDTDESEGIQAEYLHALVDCNICIEQPEGYGYRWSKTGEKLIYMLQESQNTLFHTEPFLSLFK